MATKQKKRADGRYRRSFRYNGKRYDVYGRTVQELNQAEHEKRLQLEQGTEDRINPTLNQYYERFSDNRRGKVKGSTLRIQTNEYNCMAAVEIEGTGKTFGELRIKDIRTGDVQQVQKALRAGGMSTQTVNDTIAHLSHVFNRAVLERVIDWNPCKAVDRLQRVEPKAKDTNHRALTENETKAFFEAMKGSYYENICKLMIQTGMRVGEVGALMVSDFDMKEGVIHVTKTVARMEDGQYFISPTPKTDSGNREIPITDAVRKVFKDQLKLNELCFGNVDFSRPLFRSSEGELLRGYSLNREIDRKCKPLGIEHFSSHALRATFATRFIEQRPQDYKILSEILGHSDVKITLNLYTHVMKDSKITAMNAVEIAM